MSMFGEVIAEDAYETVPLASLEAATAFFDACKKKAVRPCPLCMKQKASCRTLPLPVFSGAHDHKVYVLG